MRAGHTEPDKALADFCEAYWPPIYAFLRHRGHPPADAQDLAQGFFAHLLERNTLSRADKTKGRLRTFLLGSLQNFLANEYDRAQTLKRGGGNRILRLDENQAEAETLLFDRDPTATYDLTWASNIVKRAWQRLQERFAGEGKTQWLDEMRPFLVGGDKAPPSQEEVATRLEIPLATFRTALMRLRQRYRDALRSEVACTVSDPADVDEELKYLYRILTG